MDTDTRKSVVLAALVHILMLYSVFDIYFISPIEHGMTPYRSEAPPLAKRVVLFVADGLRASSLYEDHHQHAPYLKSVMENVGVWGISHTQVPTESRPGHIALLAGFNEDPSAITRGWRSNPVDFDSVINQSANAWCWGSPDIVDMFNKDDLPHIHLYSYDANLQDFSGRNNVSTNLDHWVFDRFKLFIKERGLNCAEFCDSGNVIFLHLLGLDTAGHSIKPTSKKYIENIKVVDKGIKETVELIESLFNDQRTAYIFTSDHGMTDWGSHGDGSESETEVPFIAWGAGILHDTSRVDINQVNIAPLLATLVGLNIPIHSIGVIPDHVLKATMYQKAHIMYANSRQLTEQFITKHNRLEKSTVSWVFQPFPELYMIHRKIEKIPVFIAEGKYDMAMLTANQVIQLCKNGIAYYHSYHQQLLLFFVTFGFIGWILYLVILIVRFSKLSTQPFFRNYQMETEMVNFTTYIIYGSLALIATSVFLQSFFKYYLYLAFCLIWILVAKNLKTLFALGKFAVRVYTLCDILVIISYVIGIEVLVVAFFKRQWMALMPVYYYWKFLYERHIYISFWDWFFHLLMLIALAFCPFILEVQTEFRYEAVFISMVLWVDFYKHYISRPRVVFLAFIEKEVMYLQICMLLLAFLNILFINHSFTHGFGLNIVLQIMSWFFLAMSPFFPTVMTGRLEVRLLSSVLALSIPYTLMAAGFEHIFLHLLVRIVLNWASAESVQLHNINSMHERFMWFQAGDLRLIEYSFYLLMFLMFSYFGVGNSGSINSFDPMWVRGFVTVFSPFTMAALVMVKFMVPFLIVLCGFKTLIGKVRGASRFCFFVLLFFCDIMVIQFLYLVKNEGSWLEIGVSLSRFIVLNVATIAIIVLYQLANFLTTFEFLYLQNLVIEYYM